MAEVSNTQSVRAFCAARDAFWEFWDDEHLGYLVYSSVFESARPASQQVHLKRT